MRDRPLQQRLLLVIVVAAGLFGPVVSKADTTPVTIWTDEGDSLGEGNANWHSLAIMHMAMHDALNAASPTYARWAPPSATEPSNAGAAPQAAMEAAAARVLTLLHPAQGQQIARLLALRLNTIPPGAAREAGLALGTAIGDAWVARRQADGFLHSSDFPGSDVPGKWRPTPPSLRSSGITETEPFLFASKTSLTGRAPPEPGSPRYLSDVATTRRLGGAPVSDRTPAQTEAATFWAYQSTQRGFIHLAATLIDNDPRLGDLAVQARLMSQLSAAMADSAILIWNFKLQWNFWRPVTAIQSGAFGVSADASWQSVIETPPHPEYPSGHASDCYTAAGFLQTIFGTEGPVTYTAQSALVTATQPGQVWSSDMGDPQPPVELAPLPRVFQTVEQAAQECADSRIWAGAHFPSANEESRRIAGLIVQQAVAAVPPLNH